MSKLTITGKCKTCGATVRATKDRSLAVAMRIHYWKYHPEIMLSGKARGLRATKGAPR